MDNDYTERQEGPDGQYCYLLTRVPYDVQRMIEAGMAVARTNNDRLDACFRGLLWGERNVKDTLTGEMTDDVDRAAAEVIQPWRVRAAELYNDWWKQAFPGPKGSPRKGSPTQSSGKAQPPSETSEAA